jgi:hypothetical protein
MVFTLKEADIIRNHKATMLRNRRCKYGRKHFIKLPFPAKTDFSPCGYQKNVCFAWAGKIYT